MGDDTTPETYWKLNIKTNLDNVGRKDVDWLHLAQDRVQRPTLVKRVLNVLVP
jgi:hypothetical protein